MKNNNTRKAYTLATKISNFMNETNHNCFNHRELISIVKDYMYMLLYNDTKQIIDMLESEITDGNTEVLPLYKQVITF